MQKLQPTFLMQDQTLTSRPTVHRCLTNWAPFKGSLLPSQRKKVYDTPPHEPLPHLKALHQPTHLYTVLSLIGHHLKDATTTLISTEKV